MKYTIRLVVEGSTVAMKKFNRGLDYAQLEYMPIRQSQIPKFFQVVAGECEKLDASRFHDGQVEDQEVEFKIDSDSRTCSIEFEVNWNPQVKWIDDMAYQFRLLDFKFEQTCHETGKTVDRHTYGGRLSKAAVRDGMEV